MARNKTILALTIILAMLLGSISVYAEETAAPAAEAEETTETGNGSGTEPAGLEDDTESSLVCSEDDPAEPADAVSTEENLEKETDPEAGETDPEPDNAAADNTDVEQADTAEILTGDTAVSEETEEPGSDSLPDDGDEEVSTAVYSAVPAETLGKDSKPFNAEEDELGTKEHPARYLVFGDREITVTRDFLEDLTARAAADSRAEWWISFEAHKDNDPNAAVSDGGKDILLYDAVALCGRDPSVVSLVFDLREEAPELHEKSVVIRTAVMRAAAPKTPANTVISESGTGEKEPEKTDDPEEEETKNGLVRENGKTYFYKDGNKISGQKKIKDEKGDYYWYMFRTASESDPYAMVTGWYDHTDATNPSGGPKRCYYDGNGHLQYGQKKIKDEKGNYYWYMFKPGSGAMVKGFYNHTKETNPAGGPKTCYYDANGHLLYGQKKIGGYWYMFKPGSGAMVTGFFNHTKDTNPAGGPKTCYYDENGHLLYGQRKIGGYWYMFRPGSGAMVTGFFNHTKETNPSGGPKTCYYDADGHLVYGQKKIGGYWYMFRPGSGAMVTGFFAHTKETNPGGGAKVCYYDEEGRMVYGKIEKDGAVYIMKSGSGALAGWNAALSSLQPSQMLYFNQKDDRWEDDIYGGATIGKAGCGLTAFAMIASMLRQQTITPAEIAPVVNAHKSTMYTPWFPGIMAYTNLARYYGMKSPEVRHYSRGGGVYDIAYLQKKLAEGRPMILNGHYGGVIFSSDHFVAVYGQGENGPKVYDPNWTDRCSFDGEGISWYDALASVDYVVIFDKAPAGTF